MTSTATYTSSRSQGGVPIKAWVRGVPLEDAAAARSSATSRRLPVRARLGRRDARRALGHRRDGRQRHPDGRRDHPGGGRRRHRLRHDRGADDAHRQRPPREPARGARGDRARGAARPHAGGRRQGRRGTTRRRRPSRRGRALEARLRRHHRAARRDREVEPPRRTSARSAPATTSSRSASTRRDHVWFMLHSGSRGVGNRIGTYFIELAKKDMARHVANLPDQDLAYFDGGRRALRRLRRRPSAGRRSSR